MLRSRIFRPGLHRVRAALGLLSVAALLGCHTPGVAPTRVAEGAAPSAGLYDNARQITFEGRRSGEGYFDRSGRELVFQSEREPGNPFYQIYRMSLETGATRRISNGRGKTTCGWIHPDGQQTLFASTHLDPQAESKQERELEERASGTARRYSWGFDPHYDLFAAQPGGHLERLTEAHGYDAEASYSPDGRWVAFSSNRHAYDGVLGAEDRERLVEDPSYFVDLYLLDTESGEIRRLTDHSGYDGGPFFSPDGLRIVWRRFSEDGARAEIHSIRVDGTDEQVLTHLGVMSWAPFYHPSGDYIVFTTNRHGYDNFELYIVDAAGGAEPVRVTTRDGFDGLPVFSPSGDRLLWTSNHTTSSQSQLFMADWNDAAARRALGLEAGRALTGSLPLALPDPTRPAISAIDLEAHVAALTDPRAAGRRAGTEGERVAVDYLTRAFTAIGLEPAGDDGQLQHRFEFTSGVSLGSGNLLSISGSAERPRRFEVDEHWRPLAFSRSGDVERSPVSFAGYGLVAPAANGGRAIDDYDGLDVEDRWVMVLRDLPQNLAPERRQHLQLHASLRYKAMVARDHGARGILFVSGPLGRFRRELIPLRFDASLAGTRIAVISISDSVAEALLAGTGRSLEAIQQGLDDRIVADEATPAIAGSSFDAPTLLEGVEIGGHIEIETLRAEGSNVVGRLQVGDVPSRETIVLGAHFDHLGHGEGSSSLASGADVGQIHPGADDNASGTALLLEIAEYLAHRKRAGFELGTRDFVFAAWSGEELGLLGSNAWVAENVNPHSKEAGPVAYLNFDMVGRMRDDVVVQGLGSSPQWAALLEGAAAPLALSIFPQEDSYVPTDATSFYTQGVPVLNAFTGVHAEYHTPGDTLDRLNLEGTARIGRLFARIAEAVSRADAAPSYQAQKAPSLGQGRSGFRVFLGTVPDYAQTDVTGVRLTGVAPAGPAERGGIRGGDIIVEVDGRPIENLYDYTYALEALRVGETARIGVLRKGERLDLEVVPSSRD